MSKQEKREKGLRARISAADCRVYSAPNFAMQTAAMSLVSELRSQLRKEFGKEATNYL